MGRDKAWIQVGGRSLIEWVIDALRPICPEILIVTSNPAPFAGLSCDLVGDVYPGKGSLGGMYSGLLAARNESAIVVACDMPFLNSRLLEHMVSLSNGYDVVIPNMPGPFVPGLEPHALTGRAKANGPTAKDSDLHPLHAVYSKRCVGFIKCHFEKDDLRMIGFHADVNVRLVERHEVEQFDPARLSLFNVNTPADLAIAESIAAGGGKSQL